MKAILLFILSFVIFTSCGKGASLSEAELLGLERCVAERPDSVYAVLKDAETRELSPSALALYYLVRTEAEDKLYMTHTTDSLIALSRTYYESTDDAAHLAKAWYLTGRIHTDWEQWDKATADFLRAEELTEGSEDWGLKGRIAEYLGVVNWKNELYDKALSYHKKAFSYFTQIPDSTNMIYALRGQGNVYWSLKEADSALYVFQEALKVSQSIQNRRLISSISNRLGYISSIPISITQAPISIKSVNIAIKPNQERPSLGASRKTGESTSCYAISCRNTTMKYGISTETTTPIPDTNANTSCPWSAFPILSAPRTRRRNASASSSIIMKRGLR